MKIWSCFLIVVDRVSDLGIPILALKYNTQLWDFFDLAVSLFLGVFLVVPLPWKNSSVITLHLLIRNFLRRRIFGARFRRLYLRRRGLRNLWFSGLSGFTICLLLWFFTFRNLGSILGNIFCWSIFAGSGSTGFRFRCIWIGDFWGLFGRRFNHIRGIVRRGGRISRRNILKNGFRSRGCILWRVFQSRGGCIVYVPRFRVILTNSIFCFVILLSRSGNALIIIGITSVLGGV